MTISINGVEIETLRISDCPADARGALSYINGHPGIYGYLHNVTVDPSSVLNAGTLTIRYEVKADAEAKGGLALYGARIGRYPTGPHLLIRQK